MTDEQRIKDAAKEKPLQEIAATTVCDMIASAPWPSTAIELHSAFTKSILSALRLAVCQQQAKYRKLVEAARFACTLHGRCQRLVSALADIDKPITVHTITRKGKIPVVIPDSVQDDIDKPAEGGEKDKTCDLDCWPCQDLMGGRGAAIYANENGMCRHPECHPRNRETPCCGGTGEKKEPDNA